MLDKNINYWYRQYGVGDDEIEFVPDDMLEEYIMNRINNEGDFNEKELQYYEKLFQSIKPELKGI